MIKRPLGRTGIDVSLLALGTVKFGRNQRVAYPHPYEVPSDRALARLLGVARELGVCLLDTAPAYGQSEERLGRLLTGQRRDWVVVTKVGEEFEDGVSRFDFSADHVRHSVERSLTRLRTDYLDVVLVHSNGNDVEIARNGETLEALAALKHAGTIRAFGMSHKTVQGGLEAIARTDVVMTALSSEDESMVPVIARAADVHRGVLIKKPLGSGHLATAQARRASLLRAAALPGVSSIVVGTIDPVHLEENASALSSIRV